MSNQVSCSHMADFLKSTLLDMIEGPIRMSRALGDCFSLEDAARLTAKMGFELEFTDQFPPHVSGFTEISDDCRLIVINNTKHPAHQIATLGHEISHFLLHTNVPGMRIDIKEECQANLLAFLLIFKRCDSDMAKELFRHNQDLTVSLGATLVAAGFAILATGVAELETWIKEQQLLADESAVQNHSHLEKLPLRNPMYYSSRGTLSIAPRHMRSLKKASLFPTLNGYRVGTFLPRRVSSTYSTLGTPVLSRKRKGRISTRQRVLSQFRFCTESD